MKKCPQCGREYDVSMMFCLDDGTELLYGPGTVDEPQTAILHPADGSGEAPTRAQIHTPEQTAVLPSGVADVPKRGFDKRLLAAPIVLAVMVLGGFFGYRYLTPADSGQINSIAVLPFQNKSGDANSEYLSDGLAESLIYRLSQLPNLKVSPTSSVIRYKGKDTEIAKIASELGVDAVMTGRLAQIGDNLTISVELVDVRNNKLLWGEQYERKMSELLATQREIATEITNKLKLKLSGESEQKLAKKYTVNSEAFQLYLKGRYFWNKRTLENIRKSIEQFKAAAEIDSNYALAYAGLADSYAVLPFYGLPSTEVLPQARANAIRALEIDDSLSEAHTSLAFINTNLWNWAEAEKGYLRAIELNPNYPHAHKWYGDHLGNLGRLNESLREHKRAEELEPLSLIVILNVAERYLALGDLKAALEQCQRAVDLDPNWYFARQLLSLIYLKQGRNAEALAEAEKSVDLSNRQSWPLGVLGYIYAQTGRRSEALTVVKELQEKYSKREASGNDIARVYLGLGEKEQAFAWLEKDFRSRDSTIAFWLYQVPLISLREDPRFKDLVARMGMTE